MDSALKPTEKFNAAIISPLQFLLDFLKWWYIDSTAEQVRFIMRTVELLFDRLSISALFRNFFVPWHRDSTWLGIMFGVIMRIIWLPIALAIVLLTILLGLAYMITWVSLPPYTIYKIIFFWL